MNLLTLFLLVGSQGGAVDLTESAGNNYPLRGGKKSDCEGGIRAVTVVNGGYLPDVRRGQIESGMMHIADWYVTWCSMLGIDPSDIIAVQHGLPDVDGYNMWPVIIGEATQSPRSELPISRGTLLSGEWKLIRRNNPYSMQMTAVWPTEDTQWDDDAVLQCNDTNLCLFNLTEDPSECMLLSRYVSL